MIFINYLYDKLIYIFQRIFLFILILSSLSAYSQEQNLRFLEIHDDARINALGGNNISSYNNNPYFFLNPSFVGEKKISINYLKYILDINSSSILYSDSIKYIGKFGVGIKYFSHGKFRGFDKQGNYTGDFFPKEYLINFGKSYRVSNITIGTNIKFFNSKLYDESYSGFLVDVGMIYIPEKIKNLTLALVLSNYGFLLTNNHTDLPSNIKIGLTFKPEYMPLRFSFTFYQPQKNNFISQNISLGIEVLLSKYFNILVGYNHRNNKSFKLNNDKLRGLSYGLELTLKRINLNYSRLILNSISNSNNISINYNLKKN
jgi:hypothetical protein|tara:strand:+ start:527 stop:1474 length:948 start_codon:yes stop_codon:yes gene_type:complete